MSQKSLQKFLRNVIKTLIQKLLKELYKKKGYNRRVAPNKLFINECNRKRRLNFAQEYYLKDES